MIDLLAPQREDVVAATAAGARLPCDRSLRDLSGLEAGDPDPADRTAFPANMADFRGLLRDAEEEGVNGGGGRTVMDGAGDESEESSALGGSMWGGASSLAGDSALGGGESAMGGGSALGRRSSAGVGGAEVR